MTELLKKNLELLRKNSSEIHQALAAFAPSDNTKAVPTLSGNPTLLRWSAGHGAAFLHSIDDPVEEAEKLIEGFSFRGEDISVLFGFGLGYIPLAIAKRMHRDHRLFVVEASLEPLYHACRLMDLSALFTDKRIQIISTPKIHILWKALEQEQFRILGGRVGKIIHPPSFSLNPVEYQEAERNIEQIVAAIQTNFLTLDHHGEFTAPNIIQNLQSLPDSAPVDALFDLFPETPALVVAAGPSLDKNIAQVRAYRGHLVIIAVDTALKPLLAAGITPHLVVSVDPIQANLKKFEAVSSSLFESLPLVFSPYVLPAIPQRFNGPKFVFNEHNQLSQWAVNLWHPAATLPYGFSVAHYAFYLARTMGADPIIFIGLDLAFSGDRAHAANCAGVWDKDAAKTDYPQVTDIYGNKVSTDPGFIKMIALFEREIAQTDRVCIDATEGGALIDGTKILGLKQALEEYTRQGIPGLSELVRKKWAENRVAESDGIRKGIGWLSKEAGQVELLCDEALPVLNPLLNQLNGDIGSGVRNEIAKINAIADRMGSHPSFKEIVKDRLARVLVAQFKLKYQLERIDDERERLRLDIQQSHLFFSRMGCVSRQIIESIPSSTFS